MSPRSKVIAKNCHRYYAVVLALGTQCPLGKDSIGCSGLAGKRARVSRHLRLLPTAPTGFRLNYAISVKAPSKDASIVYYTLHIAFSYFSYFTLLLDFDFLYRVLFLCSCITHDGGIPEVMATANRLAFGYAEMECFRLDKTRIGLNLLAEV